MNKFIIVFALFAVLNSVRCDSSEEVLEKVKSKHLKKYLSQNKEHLDTGLEKLESKCPGASEKLKAALVSFQECDDAVDDSLTICHAIQRYTLNCTRPILKVVEDCLPEKARGLPTLALKSILSVADYLCKQTGESIFELANPCLYEGLDAENDELSQCEEKVKRFAAKHQHEPPTKTEVCSGLTGLRSCITSYTTTSCKNQKTKNVITGVYDALIAPCSHINEV